MAENLAFLPTVSPSTEGSDTNPYFYIYDYEGAYIDSAKATETYLAYGVLYNWEAARTSCPSGWHLPTDEEWKILELEQGMSESDADMEGYRPTGYVGGKIKESGTGHWSSPNTGATNSSGFTALPGGYRNISGGFRYLGEYAYFWSSQESDALYAWGRKLGYNGDGVYRSYGNKMYGFPIRCLKN
jgi:uncharacterized protein (TIGR02145 family)